MHRIVASLAFTVVALSLSTSAAADQFSWSLTGTGVAASGMLTTAGNASSFEAVTGFSGVFNGLAISGLVPVIPDPLFFYDNLFNFVGGAAHVTAPGLLLDVAGLGHVNVGELGTGPGAHYALYFDGPGSAGVHVFENLTFAGARITAAIPEPSTVALMLAGLGAMGLARRRRR